MSTYPYALDSDISITRVEDNISEVGGEAINQLRAAVFAEQKELGVKPAGTAGSVAARLDKSLNPDGSIKASALTSIGLATLPITNSQIANNAGIEEYKLNLDYSTSDLHTLIASNTVLLNSLSSFYSTLSSDLSSHIGGVTFLADGTTKARHVASHIDLNSIPNDTRDNSYTWTGLKDKDGNNRPATHVADALLQINDNLTDHENLTSEAHPASAVTVDTSNFKELSQNANTVQKAIEELDGVEFLNLGRHKATQHANAVPRVARSNSLSSPDGYGQNVVPSTLCTTYLVHAPANGPNDSNSVGDDIITFNPTNSGFNFDAQFSQVKPGDVVRVNYGNGIETSYYIDSIRFTPGSEWAVRINGVNLYNSDGYTAYARIDRPEFDRSTAGVLALAPANSIPSTLYPNIIGSLIVGHPRGASVLGIGFDPHQLDSSHYKLYLELYPSGNPSEKVIQLPAIDVTGNAGTTPGAYTLSGIVKATNNEFRRVGYNYRFIAFEYNGEFGLMLADAVGNASFAVISGSNSSGTLVEGSFTQNVIADATDDFDALGLGQAHANVAGPAYVSGYTTADSALTPTKVISPAKNRSYIVNGVTREDFAATYLANSDGYWKGTITARNSVGSSIEVTYTVDLDLCSAELKPGKTILVQPLVDFSDPAYFDVDYGRFIIKSVTFTEPCGDEAAKTQITVINGIHAVGTATAFSSSEGLEVALYFSESSVSFNDSNVVTPSTSLNYHRLHEIYITDEGKTHAHERARLPIQSETSSLLRTDYWHVTDVSPKLRGYKDNVGDVNSYLRFYITSFETDAGTFDGYIGRRNPSTGAITSTGPLTRGSKNTPIRFYDETYVDYIELQFVEQSASPGVSILSDGTNSGGGTPRYVDIELFPSMKLHDEVLILGTCEVNWDPPTGQNVVENVRTTRQMGSIDEEDFTESAISFINASDRFLHENGVFRGYKYLGANASNSRELLFGGGTGLVNGKVVTSNNVSVTIPNALPGGAAGDTFWWVCVNEFGGLIPIYRAESPSQQFIAVPGSGTTPYFVESISFYELTHKRKDLTPIALVSAEVDAGGILTITTVYDLRKFVNQPTVNAPLVLSSEDQTANFYSFESLYHWLMFYRINNRQGKNKVTISGQMTIDSMVTLTELPGDVIFEGDGARITVNSAKGLSIGRNVTLRNITFVYNPPNSITYGTNDHVASENGCIYVDATAEDLANIEISGCTFICESAGSQRPPFISVRLNEGRTVSDVIIRDNKFTDSNSTNSAAVAFVNLNAATSSTAAALADVLIENNFTDANQGIYLTSAGKLSQEEWGLNVFNGRIVGNRCGVIGFLTSDRTHGTYSKSNLVIRDNTCKLIGCTESTGMLANDIPTFSYGTGNVVIDGNSCHWIQVVVKVTLDRDIPIVEQGRVKIINNTLTASTDATFLDTRVDSNVVSGTYDSAIIVFSKSSSAILKELVIVSNNLIDVSEAFGTYSSNSVDIRTSSIFTNNIINTIKNGKNGLTLSSPNSYVRDHIITGNKFYRVTNGDSNSIAAYISISNTTSDDTGICTDNFFDKTTIDGTSTALISGAPTGWIIERNKNQTAIVKVPVHAGSHSVSPHQSSTETFITLAGGLSQSISAQISAPNLYFSAERAGTSDNYIVFTTKTDTSRTSFEWVIPLAQIIPFGTKITKVSATYLASSDPTTWTQKNMTLRISKGTFENTLTGLNNVDDNVNVDTLTYTLASTSSEAVAIYENAPGTAIGSYADTANMANTYINKPEELVLVRVLGDLHNATEINVRITLTVDYMW